MSEKPQAVPANLETPKKKSYHTPDLRDFGTVKELTLTGSTPGGPEYVGNENYVSGQGNLG